MNASGRKFTSRRKYSKRVSAIGRSYKRYGKGRSWAGFTQPAGRSTKYSVGSGALNIRTQQRLNESGMPSAMFMKHAYSAGVQLSVDGTTGYSGGEIPFRLNSLYDPYFLTGSLADHQPMFYDQISALYRRYTVYQVDINLQVMNVTGTAPSLVVMFSPSGSTWNTTGSLDPARLAEKPNCTVTRVQAGSTMKWSMKIGDIDGVPRATVMNDDLYTAQIGSNPGKTPYMRMNVSSQLAGADTSATVEVMVNMVFHTRWNDYITPNQS